jgi:hypothetical protein
MVSVFSQRRCNWRLVALVAARDRITATEIGRARMTDSRIDVLRELRLRSWARAHYVPLHERKPTWHPIVLDEMRNRDREMQACIDPNRTGSRYVPLMPTELPIIHAAHEGIPQPKLLKRSCRSELRRFADFLR